MKNVIVCVNEKCYINPNTNEFRLEGKITKITKAEKVTVRETQRELALCKATLAFKEGNLTREQDFVFWEEIAWKASEMLEKGDVCVFDGNISKKGNFSVRRFDKCEFIPQIVVERDFKTVETVSTREVQPAERCENEVSRHRTAEVAYRKETSRVRTADVNYQMPEWPVKGYYNRYGKWVNGGVRRRNPKLLAKNA